MPSKPFQSSPALTGGCYAPTRVDRGPALSVSILTRPYGRMLSVSWARIVCSVPWFQSSPALTGGCYGPERANPPSPRGFNPHPPLRADAMPLAPMVSSALPLFQSSPALTGGCYPGAGWGGCCSQAGFNPHPPLRADAMADVARCPARTAGVSILTRPYGRMLWALCPGPGPARGVSILTRPYGRMLYRNPAGC